MWPIAKLVLELVYGVSALAQYDAVKKLVHVRTLNDLICHMQGMKTDSLARLHIVPVDLSDITFIIVMDASFANELGRKSQGGFISLKATESIQRGAADCNVSAFQSSTIPRVVRSTMAEESASLSTALDRHLYLRLLMESLIYGEPNLEEYWRHTLGIPGTLVTDSKSLYDHSTKAGSILTERQSLIVLLVARDLHENETVTIKWLPNKHMVADVLTKHVVLNKVCVKLITEGLYSLVQTTAQQAEEYHRQKLGQ